MEATLSEVEEQRVTSVKSQSSVFSPTRFGVNGYDSGYQGSPPDPSPGRTEGAVRTPPSTVDRSRDVGDGNAATGVEDEAEMEARLSRRKRLDLIQEWEKKIIYNSTT